MPPVIAVNGVERRGLGVTHRGFNWQREEPSIQRKAGIRLEPNMASCPTRELQHPTLAYLVQRAGVRKRTLRVGQEATSP
jgi:hypothetical protein